MANPTAVSDIEARWRPLSPSETIVATSLLADAWSTLIGRVPSLDQRLTDGSVSPDLVVAVVSAMVLRVLRNPEGKRQESLDDYSYTRDQALSAGVLYVTDAEIDLLSVRTHGAFSIMPAYE